MMLFLKAIATLLSRRSYQPEKHYMRGKRSGRR